MSKLPLVDALTFEKLLLHLGFEIKRRKGSHVFTDIPMDVILHFRITATGLLEDH